VRVTARLVEGVDPLRRCLHYSAPIHHDQVVIFSSGSSSSYERDKGKNFGRTHLHKVCASDGELNGKYTKYPTSCISVNSLRAIYDGTKVSNG
jgi:hypothetical protein